MRILIVDDDLVARTVLEGIMSKYGECVLSVEGKESVELFETALKENNPYHLILMDIMMPVMNGIDAMKEIRKIEDEKNISEDKKTKVIMVTALADPQIVIESYYRGGADSYIVKPIHKKQLLDEVLKLGLIESV
ncbi:MAG: response regulator [Nitrospirae bacterium]|nr:response regulator [Nitrospirota bacterium]